MTVSSQTSRVSYAGNGSTTAFAVSFYFLADSHLKVILRAADGSETVKTLTADYTVSGAGNPSGGTVTMGTAPAAGTTLVIVRNVPLTQETDYQANDPFPAESHERALDKLTMAMQTQQIQIDRSLKLKDSTSTAGLSTELPDPKANNFIGWNKAASGLQNIDASTLVTIAAYGTARSDVFTGDGLQTEFTLSYNPGSLNNLDVSIDGATRVNGVDFTWMSGTTLTTTTAVPNGAKMLVRYMQGLPTTTADSDDVQYIPGSGQATTVQTRLRAHDAKLAETVSVKDFGAVGDGVVDDTAAIQAAIDSLFANNGASLYFPDGIYYLGTPVVINFDAQNSIRLHGSSTSNFFNFNTGGSRIVGAAGIESMFILTKTDLSTAGGYGFECDHIFFKSASLGSGGPLTAIKNKIGGAPVRPFVIANCGFIGFDKAIVSDISGTGGLQTGICQVTIRESTFVSCNYALYGTGGSGNIMDLLFTGNASENGGKIYIDGLLGTCNISDNLLEGQADAIYIVAGLASVSIKRNYFEANTGYLMYVSASNPRSTVSEENNYITNCSGAKVFFRNMQVDTKTNWKINSVLFDAPQASASSVFNNDGVIVPNTWSVFNYCFSLNSISKQTSVPPGPLTNGAYNTLGASSEVTPIGTINFQSVTGNSSYMTPAAISLTLGDAIVAMAIARRTSSNPNIYLTVYDNAYTLIGNSDTSRTLFESAAGEWVFIASIVKVTGNSSGAPRIRWVTSGGTADISSTYFYKVVAPTNNSTEAYFCMLNP